MNITFRCLAAILVCTQLIFPQRLSHALNAVPPERSIRSAAAFPETLRVLAIMVQFQTDNDSRTSGNGRFDLSVSDERIIDPPPHDSAYFADHFRFADNYFAKASNGKQFIAATVLGTVITVKKQMREYAPVSSNLPLAALIEEAWQAADSLHPGFPFQHYDLFAVFHAGVGKDIDLRAALGYDPTPLDLPSLYFSLNALRSLFGPAYPGVTLKNSSFRIPNSVILPETEVRRIPGVGGDVVLKLGINGLLAASIGSHLGLPDLFDTKTGKSAIGRFGLMDGQSIFSYYGIAPPEPSAWEKIHLGWTTPITLTGTQTVPLPAAGLHNTGNDTIYKIPISAKEYFLVENRHRDAHANGQTVTVRWKGNDRKLFFTQDTVTFSNNSIDSVYGVVIDVEEPDWSLPGLINANNSYRGGALIWHIDESVIDKHLAANTVNADPSRRGVDLEEADGSQDIGQSYDFGDPASGSEDGSPIDYWFSGNIFPNYSNTFSERTLPNSLSNTFARSHVTLKDFSVQAPRMTFTAQIGSPDVRLEKIITRPSAKSGNGDAPIAMDLNRDGVMELVYTAGDSIYVLKNDLTPYLNNGTGLFAAAGGRFQPAAMEIVSRGENALVGVQGNRVLVYSATDADNNGLADTLYSRVLSSEITSPPAVYSNSGSGHSNILLGMQSGQIMFVYNVFPNSWLKDSLQILHSPVVELTLSDVYSGRSSDSLRLFGTRTGFNGVQISSFSDGLSLTVALLKDHSLYIKASYTLPEMIRTIQLNGTAGGAFAVHDVNGDGKADILVGVDDQLYCYNINGVVMENFPWKVLDGGRVAGSPVVTQRTADGAIVIVFGTTNGHLYAIDLNGKILPGFPLQTGGIASSPVLWNDKLSIASTDSSIYTWNVGALFDTAKIHWGGYLGDASHSNKIAVTTAGPMRSSELLPKRFAYNWPNPAYGTTTQIRYYLTAAATVSIKIVNMAGELVEELKGSGTGGMDNEVTWDISRVQSGIYFAQITANGNGTEMSQIVKIAVVK